MLMTDANPSVPSAAPGPRPSRRRVIVRNIVPADFEGIREMARLVYPGIEPWGEDQLRSHLEVFPEGQFVAVEANDGTILGSCAGLIVKWEDYEMSSSWRSFTDAGYFTNHDPVHGRTLYGADVMVRPGQQGRGIGKRLYETGRFDLARRLKLLRIRAGARLRGYHRYAKQMTAEEYVIEIVNGRIGDRTLSFQLRRGFHVIGVVSDYFAGDPESLGHAAIIEAINDAFVKPGDVTRGDPRFLPEVEPG